MAVPRLPKTLDAVRDLRSFVALVRQLFDREREGPVCQNPVMAKRFWLLPLVIILISPMTIRVPFEMRIVDEQTGIGIPNLRVTTEDGNVCHTLGGGSCY